MCDSRVVQDLLENTRNVGGGVLAGGLGAPVDIATMLMRPAGYKVPDNKVVGSSEHIAGLLGLDTKSAPYMVGSLLPTDAGDAMKYAGLLGGHIAYHGSPHKFDKFDSKKIGTGEGAQAYGHGIYFAESPDVARGYANNVTTQRLGLGAVDGVQSARLGATEQAALADLKLSGGDVQKALERLKSPPKGYEESFAARARILEDVAEGNRKAELAKGSLYKVDIKDDALPKMLDWDKPLSEQPKILEKMRKAVGDNPEVQDWLPKTTGEQLHNNILPMIGVGRGGPGGFAPDMAADWLKGLGIPGIRYKDAGSRSKDGGTSNFVLFDDSLVKILERK